MAARRLYFAYGANLSQEAMRERCPPAAARKLGPAVLSDHRLEFRQDDYGFGVANVAPARGQQVPGGLWRVNPTCLANLDCYEAYPRVYARKRVRVLFRGKAVGATTYVLRDKRPAAVPDPDYVDTIRRGYGDFALNRAVLEEALKWSQRHAARVGRRRSVRTPAPG